VVEDYFGDRRAVGHFVIERPPKVDRPAHHRDTVRARRPADRLVEAITLRQHLVAGMRAPHATFSKIGANVARRLLQRMASMQANLG
jgi:hypothetical protein